ncbi:MAG: peptidase U32 family protein [Syntrophobacterales bacterium]|jgi:putative protease
MDLGQHRNQPELLAPAGNIESFFAALDNGADAVYVGYRHHNARALAANFTLEEIARLNEYAHQQNARLYVALNALAREEELEELVSILAGLAQIEPDGLIIQDGAVARLCLGHFPNLNLHASTLMTVHNCAGVEQLATMGFQRAVLARELSLDEVSHIAANTHLQLETFVHGALCLSYSGLCLASSYFGGRSSLRGRCAQPCRRLYRSGRQQGYFLSTNDLSAIDLIPKLRKLGLAALKIEGRMKPASYVAAAVRAYRNVLDAPEGKEKEAISAGRQILREAYGRKPTLGFYVTDQHKEIITPHRSGASGRLAGNVEWVRGKRMALRLRLPLNDGDRLRLDSNEAVEKSGFTIRNMISNGRSVKKASAGNLVTVGRIAQARRGDRIFKTGSKGEARTSAAKCLKVLRQKTSTPPKLGSSPGLTERILSKSRATKADKQPNDFYLRLSDLKLLNAALDSGARWVIIQASRANLHNMRRRKLPPVKRNRLFWALPAIIPDSELSFYQDEVHRLQQIGNSRWLVANWAHFRIFSEPPEMLMADYTFNVLNSQASSLLKDLGCQLLILSLESDRQNLQKLVPAIRGITPLVTVHGWPPLFMSRLKLRVRVDSTLHGPTRERFQYRRHGGLTEIHSDRPLCLLEHLNDLAKVGVKGFVVDLRGQKLRPNELHAIMKTVQRQSCPQPHSTFNYLGKLV